MLVHFDNETETAPAAGRRRGHGRGTTCRVGKGEQGQARPAISAPRGGALLDLACLRLNVWPKSGFSIAGTAWRTLSSMYLHTRPRGYQCENQTLNPGKDAIPPVVSPQCTARVLVHRYVTTTSRGVHTVDQFDERNRCLVSHTRYVHTGTCTKYEGGGCTSGQIFIFENIIQSASPASYAYNADSICTRTHRTLVTANPSDDRRSAILTHLP